MIDNKPKTMIYVPSKGRYDTNITANSLEKLGVKHKVVVEPQEFNQYKNALGEDRVLVLPFSNHGDGPTHSRNFIWEYSKNEGEDWHWVMDDNIDGFVRFNNNRKIQCKSAGIFKAAEDFVWRYENISMAGLEYRFFIPDRSKRGPYRLNTRIYSCNLIKNNTNYRWEGRYNEDTDLSLRMLKDGWVTVLFQAFLCNKAATQTVSGGNSKEFYDGEGTLPKSQLLVNKHPDVSRLAWRYERWHHDVDYQGFKQKLKLKDGLNFKDKNNNYGMKLEVKK